MGSTKCDYNKQLITLTTITLGGFHCNLHINNTFKKIGLIFREKKGRSAMASRGCNFCSKVGSQPISNDRASFNYSCLEVKKKDAKRKKKKVTFLVNFSRQVYELITYKIQFHNFLLNKGLCTDQGKCSSARIAIAQKPVFKANLQIRCLVLKTFWKKKFRKENVFLLKNILDRLG